MISVCFKGKPFNIMVIQVYALTSNAEEAEVEWFSEYLQDLLDLTSKKDVLFIIGDWDAKVKSHDQTRQYIKKQRHYSAKKGPSSQSYGFFQESSMDVTVGL